MLSGVSSQVISHLGNNQVREQGPECRDQTLCCVPFPDRSPNTTTTTTTINHIIIIVIRRSQVFHRCWRCSKPEQPSTWNASHPNPAPLQYPLLRVSWAFVPQQLSESHRASVILQIDKSIQSQVCISPPVVLRLSQPDLDKSTPTSIP